MRRKINESLRIYVEANYVDAEKPGRVSILLTDYYSRIFGQAELGKKDCEWLMEALTKAVVKV